MTDPVSTVDIIAAAVPWVVIALVATFFTVFGIYYTTEPYRRARRLRGEWTARFFEEHTMPAVDEMLARRFVELRRAATRTAIHTKPPAILPRSAAS